MNLYIDFSGVSLICTAIMLLVLPLKWWGAILFAAIIHELCHIFAVFLSGGHVCEVDISHRGVIMIATPMQYRQELICTLAGSLGSILLFLCYPWIPRIAICAGMQGVYNLLPVYPLDGGRIVKLLAERFFAMHAIRICRIVEYCTILCVLSAGLGCYAKLNIGVSPLLLSLLLVFRVKAEKNLANSGN